MVKERSLNLHPFFFAVYPVLFFYSHNIKEITLDVIFLPLTVVLGICLVLWFVLFFLKNKKGIVLSLFFFMFFSYGHLAKLLFGEEIRLFFPIVYMSIFLALLVGIFRLKKDLNKFNSVLNIVSLFLVLISIFNIANYELKHRLRITPLEYEYTAELNREKTLDKEEDFPDIYYIIFDRYASSETLAEFFDFDNTVFEVEMEKRGFYMASRSRANYPYSYLSLASSLNYDYLDFIFDHAGKSADKTIVYPLLKKSRAVQFLKSQGYKYYHFGAWWEPTRTNPLADETFLHESFALPLFDLDEFSSKLIQTTLLDFFIKNFTSIKTESGGGGSRIVYYQFDQLEKIPHMAGPKFVFAHIFLTHPPYFFNKEGILLSHSTIKEMEEKELYLESVLFANKKILHLVDTLISDSARPPVIILQADEGPYARIVKSLEEWKKADRMLRFRTGILNSYYLPQKNQTILHKEISPVNTFRIIFNLYFGTSFEILEDKTFISARFDNLYEFNNITKTIRLGTLIVNSTPTHAMIYLDGLDVERKTNRIIREIQPGTHTLTLKKKNFVDYETTFHIDTGERKTIEVTLKPKKTGKTE